MSDFIGIDDHVEFPALGTVASTLEDTPQVIGDESITNEKLAGGISPTKLTLLGLRAELGTPQTTADATGEDVLFDTTSLNQGFSDPGVTFTDFAVPFSGMYLLTAQVVWESDTTGARNCNIQVNGSTEIGDRRPADATTRTPVSGSAVLEGGDLVGIQVSQTSGGNLDLNTAVLTAVYLGAI